MVSSLTALLKAIAMISDGLVIMIGFFSVELGPTGYFIAL
jgi:hypothetical protein